MNSLNDIFAGGRGVGRKLMVVFDEHVTIGVNQDGGGSSDGQFGFVYDESLVFSREMCFRNKCYYYLWVPCCVHVIHTCIHATRAPRAQNGTQSVRVCTCGVCVCMCEGIFASWLRVECVRESALKVRRNLINQPLMSERYAMMGVAYIYDGVALLRCALLCAYQNMARMRKLTN